MQAKQAYSETLSAATAFDMVYIEGGSFDMGCNDYDNEKPVHRVELPPFFFGKFPVTQSVWAEIMGENPSHFKGENRPVEQVSWDDVQVFIKKLNQKTGKNYRLPTEAEWEFAARGGIHSEGFLYAGSDKLKEVGWFAGNSGSETKEVGLKYPNELGLFDMSGNVWEWCSDWYDNYPAAAQTNPQGPSSGSDRVSRGGSWGYYPVYCRAAYRGSWGPSFRNNRLGFRLARQ